MNNFTRKQILIVGALAFFVGAAGSVVFNKFVFPKLSTVQGFAWVGKLQSTSPVIINRREEVRLNEGVNLIELTKQAQTTVTSIFSTGPNAQLLGNGLIITSDGTIFTTKTVVGEMEEVQVVVNDGSVYSGLVRAMDPKSELAVVTIQANNLPVAQFYDARNMQTAQRVFSIGKSVQDFDRQFISGLVSQTLVNSVDFTRVLSTEVFEHTLETDANFNSDYIGSPVVNLQGLVVGMVISETGRILPAEAVTGAVRSYLQSGSITRPYIGMTYQTISESVAEVRGLAGGGALVVSTVAGSPAAQAGLLAGDIITQINSQDLQNSNLEVVLQQQGTLQFNLTVLRAGQIINLNLTAQER
jgi:S1-C subfamily serine protease